MMASGSLIEWFLRSSMVLSTIGAVRSRMVAAPTKSESSAEEAGSERSAGSSSKNPGTKGQFSIDMTKE